MLDSVLRGHPGAKRARGLAALRLDWPDVAGPEFEGLAWPDRFEPGRGGRAGALVVRAAPGAALLLQHDGPRLAERVNAFLGADAVARIKVAPGPMPRGRTTRAMPARPLAEDDPRARAVAAKAERVGSEKLAAALTRLGRAVGGQRDY